MNEENNINKQNDGFNSQDIVSDNIIAQQPLMAALQQPDPEPVTEPPKVEPVKPEPAPVPTPVVASEPLETLSPTTNPVEQNSLPVPNEVLGDDLKPFKDGVKKKKPVLPIIILILAVVGYYAYKYDVLSKFFNNNNNNEEKITVVEDATSYLEKDFNLKLEDNGCFIDGIEYDHCGKNDKYKVYLTYHNGDKKLIHMVKIEDIYGSVSNLKEISKAFLTQYNDKTDVWFDLAHKFGTFEYAGKNSSIDLVEDNNKAFFSYTAAKDMSDEKVNSFEILNESTMKINRGKGKEIKFPEVVAGEKTKFIGINDSRMGDDGLLIQIKSSKGKYSLYTKKESAKDLSSSLNGKEKEIIEINGKKVLHYTDKYDEETVYLEKVYIPFDGSDFEYDYLGEKEFLTVDCEISTGISTTKVDSYVNISEVSNEFMTYVLSIK